MVRLIETALRDTITAANYVERYGGVAIPASVPIGDDEPPKIVPVSDTITARDCFDGGKWKKLVPDSAYTSLVWIEGTTPPNVSFGGAKMSIATITGTAVLVVWLNLKKLGKTDADISLFILDMTRRIVGGHAFDIGASTGNLAYIQRARIVEDKRSIFAKYSFAGNDPAFFYPHAAFGIELDYKIDVSLNCLDVLSGGNPIDCILEW